MVYIYYIAREGKMECLKLIFAYNFMILIDRIALRNLNGRCDVTFNHIAYERLNFHQICLFPQNIFVMSKIARNFAVVSGAYPERIPRIP